MGGIPGFLVWVGSSGVAQFSWVLCQQIFPMFKKYIDGGRGMSIFLRDQYVNTLVIYGLLHQPMQILRLRCFLAQTLALETL